MRCSTFAALLFVFVALCGQPALAVHCRAGQVTVLCKEGSDDECCQDVCEPPCQAYATCTGRDTCECTNGYAEADDEAHTCQPVCTAGCVNGYCKEPDECACLQGFEMRANVCTQPHINSTADLDVKPTRNVSDAASMATSTMAAIESTTNYCPENMIFHKGSCRVIIEECSEESNPCAAGATCSPENRCVCTAPGYAYHNGTCVASANASANASASARDESTTISDATTPIASIQHIFSTTQATAVPDIGIIHLIGLSCMLMAVLVLLFAVFNHQKI